MERKKLKRLTYKHMAYKSKVLIKMQKIEHIEDKFNMPIVEASELIGKKIFVVREVRRGVNLMVPEIVECECWNVDLRGNLYVGNEFSFKTYKLIDYGKTWAYSQSELSDL